ncbi:MAG: DUF1385 domain-containing protein, partial [Candidatus Sericytochromatia bacterium]|nr:DUF1385 domain-containing protein [Candidatus Sericytochromatia bacterium]
MEDKYAPLGGQAVIEGVMMRSPDALAIAVRKPSNKEIVLEIKPVTKNKYSKIAKMPFIRGIAALVQSMQIGMWALNLSADIVMKDLDQAEKNGQKVDTEFKLQGESKVVRYEKKDDVEEENKSFFDSATGTLSLVFSLVFTIGLFMVLPATVFNFLKDKISNVVLLNVIEGSIRLSIFLIYILAISMMKDVKRLFQYHGAEHKSIHAYEAGEELTIENARKHTTIHPRCGTNFLFLTALTSIVLFSLLGRTDSIALRVISKISLLPFVAGFSYELIRIAGQIKTKPKNIFVRFAYLLSTPGMLMLRITTKNPDDT